MTQLLPPIANEGSESDDSSSVVASADAVISSLGEFPKIVGMIESAVGKIIRVQDSTIAELTDVRKSSLNSIREAKNQAIAAIQAAIPSQPQNADNPNFQTAERTTPDQPIQPGQPS